jgi:hypothetical protein
MLSRFDGCTSSVKRNDYESYIVDGSSCLSRTSFKYPPSQFPAGHGPAGRVKSSTTSSSVHVPGAPAEGEALPNTKGLTFQGHDLKGISRRTKCLPVGIMSSNSGPRLMSSPRKSTAGRRLSNTKARARCTALPTTTAARRMPRRRGCAGYQPRTPSASSRVFPAALHCAWRPSRQLLPCTESACGVPRRDQSLHPGHRLRLFGDYDAFGGLGPRDGPVWELVLLSRMPGSVDSSYVRYFDERLGRRVVHVQFDADRVGFDQGLAQRIAVGVIHAKVF